MTEETKSEAVEKAAAKTTSKDKYELTMEAMLKAGFHFGQKKSRWNPKMAPYIFGVREGVHILDLEKSVTLFEKAMQEVEGVVKSGRQIILVGTKKQAKSFVEGVGKKLEMPYVSERWLGGALTNFSVIRKRIKFLIENREALEKGKLSHLTKLERLKLEKKLDKIEAAMGGLQPMTQLPDLMFVLDINQDKMAIKEAQKMGIKTIGIVDSNCDPDMVDFPIAGNDDAISAIKYALGVFLKTVLKAKNEA